MSRLQAITVSKDALSLTLLSLLICAFIPIIPGWNFFYGHIFFALWCTWITFTALFHKKKIHPTLAITILFFFSALYIFHFIQFGPEHRFSQDSVKIIFFFTLLAAATTAARTEHLYTLLKNFSIIFPFVFIIRFLIFKDDDWFGYSGRLYDELFGSPNVVGTFSGIAVILLLSNAGKPIANPLRLAFLIFYSALIFLGFSRSAIMATAISALLLFNARVNFSILLTAILSLLAITLTNTQIPYGPEWVIQKANILNDLTETGGSGRINLWLLSLGKIFSGLDTLFLGQGPGRIIEYMPFDKIADHPHNFYLFITLGYGLPIFILFFISWCYCFYRAIKKYIYGEKLPLALVTYYGISFVFDTHILASQFIVPHTLALSILFREIFFKKGAKKSEPTQPPLIGHN